MERAAAPPRAREPRAEAAGLGVRDLAERIERRDRDLVVVAQARHALVENAAGRGQIWIGRRERAREALDASVLAEHVARAPERDGLERAFEGFQRDRLERTQRARVGTDEAPALRLRERGRALGHALRVAARRERTRHARVREQHRGRVRERHLAHLPVAAIDPQRVPRVTERARVRIEDPAADAHERVLALVHAVGERARLAWIEIDARCGRRVGNGARGVPGRQRQRDRNAERGRARQTALARDVARDDEIGPRQRATRPFERPGGRGHVVGPGAAPREGIERQDGLLAEIEGRDAQLAIAARGGGDPGRAIDRAGQREALVVIRVLADQVHAPGRARDDFGRPIEPFAERLRRTGFPLRIPNVDHLDRPPEPARSVRRPRPARGGRGACGRWLTVALLLASAAPLPGHAEDPFLRRTATVDVVERVGPTVVNITTEQTVQQRQRRFRNPFFRDFFEPRLPRRAQSLGSGVVIDAEGHVLTNAHVVGRADVIRVTLADGREFDAELVGADPNNDIAVLRLEEAEDVPWIVPGTSEDLMVGEPVIAIGNPFGLSNSVTTGVVSALNRSIRNDSREFHGFLQTDASINPGNSGGPLMNADGELVGINTAIYQNAQGIGFAIPIDVAKRIVHELITKGAVAPVWLGVELQDLDPRLKQAFGLPERSSGALVSRVRSGTPAAAAGLERGDVVVRVAGSKVRSARGFYEVLERKTAGEQVALTVRREGGEHALSARVAEIPEREIGELGDRLLGMALEAREDGQGYDVTAVTAGSGAERVGVQAGDWILGINGKGLTTAEALRRAILDLRGRTRALVVVRRGRGRYHVTIPLS